MNWKAKAILQKLICYLPNNPAHNFYYSIQRHYGNLKDTKLDPFSRIQAGLETAKCIQFQGEHLNGKSIFEIGTGRRINTPIAYWLLGAAKTITVDLNPYLKEELVKADLRILQNSKAKLTQLLSEFEYDKSRLQELLDLDIDNTGIDQILSILKIEYLAPSDAANTELPNESIDFHTSYTVLEHIPPAVIESIFEEGNRIVKKSGLFVHLTDYSDHFSHSDKKISSINFLKYGEKAWAFLAGNRFMYMNRIRHSDMERLISNSHQKILSIEKVTNARAFELLSKKEIKLDEAYQSYSIGDLATQNAWIVSRFAR